MLRRFVLVFVLITSLAAQLPAVYAQRRSTDGAASAAATTQPSSLAVARRHAEQITAAQLKDYLYFVASDEMEGRDTPSRGLDLTAKFLATNLSRWGLKPAGDNGTFFQRIALQRVKLDAAGTSLDINGQKFGFGDGILAQPVQGVASAPLVFVNHGWFVKAKNIDPYQGVDVKDKIVVVLGGGLPKGVSFADLGGKQFVDWMSPENYAETHGARALIAIPNRQVLNNWERISQNATNNGTIKVEKFTKPGEGPKIPRIIISEKTLEALMQGEKQTAAAMLDRDQAEAIKAFDFSADKKVNLTVATHAEQIFTQNVVAIAEGRDSVLKNEYVAVGAHYDHVGTGAPGGAGRAASLKGDTSDNIWNGADDDGSGTVALLALAETLAKNPPPKRSVLFVWHCAEEKGLWGSQYFVENPTVPLAQIVTQINLDMIGRSKPEGDTNPANAKLAGPNEIYVIGSKMMSTQLGELSENTNHAYLNLKLNYLYDDPKDPNQFFYRSDHYNYAKNGIPIIFYFDGEHEDYHRPGDHPEKIDYQKMEKVTRTVFVTLWELAERPTRPVVDKPLPKDVTGDN